MSNPVTPRLRMYLTGVSVPIIRRVGSKFYVEWVDPPPVSVVNRNSSPLNPLGTSPPVRSRHK